MRPGLRAFLGTVIVVALFFPAALVMGDEITQTITSKNVATWDDPATAGNWIVQGSRYATQGFPEMKIVKTWPEALYGKKAEGKNLGALGIHGRFDRKSYNTVEIIPALKDSSGKLQPTALPLPGRAQSIDCWVWGANYNFTLDVYIRDYRGIDHVLHMGSLLFAGWKHLNTPISGAIPQSRNYIPHYAGLELTKMVITTAPDEKVDDFYFFIDEMNELTDLSIARFDGDDLADADNLNSLWQQAGK